MTLQQVIILAQNSGTNRRRREAAMTVHEVWKARATVIIKTVRRIRGDTGQAMRCIRL